MIFWAEAAYADSYRLDITARCRIVGRKILIEIRASEVARHLGLTLCVGVSGVHVFFDSSLIVNI